MTTTAAPLSDGNKPWRWMPIALVASLAINLLITGALASAYWRFRQEAPFAGNPGNINLLGFTATLPANRRQTILRQTADERRAMRPLRAEVRTARVAARAVFLAEPFDSDAFARAQSHVLDTELRARKQAQTLFLSIAGMLNREERQYFARWHPDGPPPGKGSGGGKRREGPQKGDADGQSAPAEVLRQSEPR